MRVLYLTDAARDYVADSIYYGLRKTVTNYATTQRQDDKTEWSHAQGQRHYPGL